VLVGGAGSGAKRGGHPEALVGRLDQAGQAQCRQRPDDVQRRCATAPRDLGLAGRAANGHAVEDSPRHGIETVQHGAQVGRLDRRVRRQPLRGPGQPLACRPDDLKHVVDGGHQTRGIGIAPQERVTSGRHRGRDRAGHHHQRTPEHLAVPCRVQRA
jgi:hypothetical protein